MTVEEFKADLAELEVEWPALYKRCQRPYRKCSCPYCIADLIRRERLDDRR